MLAGGGPDVCIPVLTWEAPVAGFMLKLGAAAAECPAGTGRYRLAAAICAQYVPKFFAVSPHPPALRLAMAVECAGAAAVQDRAHCRRSTRVHQSMRLCNGPPISINLYRDAEGLPGRCRRMVSLRLGSSLWFR